MFTFSLIYVCIYYQLLSLVFIFIYLYVNLVSIQRYNLSNLFFFIKNYTSYKNKFFLLPLLLSGLPPVSFFILKLSFLLKIFSEITIVIQILLFINFLLGMFFYLQLFNITISNSVNSKMLMCINNNYFSMLLKNSEESSTSYYTYWLIYFIIIYTNLFGLFFFFDIYIILYNIY